MNRIRIGLLAAMAGIWAAADAHAVRVAETGQALIYPYYSAAKKADGSAHNTYIQVTNRAADTKVVRVRIAEGRNHRAVLYFNIYLPPKGTWTAAIVPGEGNTQPRILTADKSCTYPPIPAAGQPLRVYDYIDANADGAGTDTERLAEGFIEMIEMATLNGAEAAAAEPGADGVPVNCAMLNTGLDVQFPSGLGNPTGGLTGVATIINVAGGYSIAQRATALADFTASAIYRGLSDPGPSLDAADPISHFTMGSKAYRAAWSPVTIGGRTVSGGALAVSSVLMAESLGNDVVLDKATASNTEWVVTMPTRRFFTTSEVGVQPFTRPFRAAGDCEPARMAVVGRDAAGDDATTAVPFCWSSVVLAFSNADPHTAAGAESAVLGSRNKVSVPFGSTSQNGIADLRFGDGTITSDASTRALDGVTGDTQAGAVTLRGVPALGFAVSTFNNGQVTCAAGTCKSTFAATVPHIAGR